MSSKSYRLDRFISLKTANTISDVRLLVAQKRIRLDGEIANSVQQWVGQFTHVALNGTCLQSNSPLYVKLNKPKGVVSATVDAKHKTVLDLIEHPRKDELHIVGRLDFNTTGLVLLTNDGAWSRQVSLPASGLEKEYRVTTAKPITTEYVERFRTGIFFEYEGLTTNPARLEITASHAATLYLTDGRYHQVKRMFGRFDNEVLTLHRSAIGPITLEGLAVGQSKAFEPTPLT